MNSSCADFASRSILALSSDHSIESRWFLSAACLGTLWPHSVSLCGLELHCLVVAPSPVHFAISPLMVDISRCNGGKKTTTKNLLYRGHVHWSFTVLEYELTTSWLIDYRVKHWTLIIVPALMTIQTPYPQQCKCPFCLHAIIQDQPFCQQQMFLIFWCCPYHCPIICGLSI